MGNEKNPTQPAATCDTEAAVLAGAALVDVKSRFEMLELGNGVRAVVALGNDGKPEVLDDLDPYLRLAVLGPPRRQGQIVLHEVASFIEHVNRFKLPNQTTIWANQRDFSVVAIFDDDPAGAELTRAGWRAHRAGYMCPRSPEWLAWTKFEGNEFGQEAFAQLLEDRLEDIAAKDGYPKAAELLEMARNLVINQKGTFKKTIDPTSGTGTLVCENEHGQGSTKIPRAFLLGLSVFEGGEHFAIEARIRFTMANGVPRFAYALHRRAEIERDAFLDVRAQVEKGTALPVFAGMAPG